MSLPSRERGLKYEANVRTERWGTVAPFTGAWIEIFSGSYLVPGGGVAPFTGEWIEILLELVSRQ